MCIAGQSRGVIFGLDSNSWWIVATGDSVLLSCCKSTLLEASLCRRQAGEKEKTTREGNDGKGNNSRSNCGGEIYKSGNAANNGLSGCLLSKVLIFERRTIPNALASVQRSMIIENKQIKVTNKSKNKQGTRSWQMNSLGSQTKIFWVNY